MPTWRLYAPCVARFAQDVTTRPLFLGLDLSTTCTGVTVLDHGGSVLACDVVRPRASLSLVEKSHKICNYLRLLRESHEAGGECKKTEWFVVLEGAAKRWVNGKGAATGLMTLAMLNSIISYECRSIFGCRATIVHPALPRAYFGPHISQTRLGLGLKSKDSVLNFILQGVPSFPLHSARNSTEWMCKTNFDQSDSYLLAMQSMAFYLTTAVLTNNVLRTVHLLESQSRDKESGNAPPA